MSSVLASSARLVCKRQIHHTATSQRGWLMGFFKEKILPQAATPTPEPTIAILKTTNVVSPSFTSDVLTPNVKKKSKKRPLSPESKNLRFQQNIDFMIPRLGRRPQVRLPKIAKTTWIRTLAVCQTEEELRKVMELFPKWRDMGKRFDGALSEAFICRCIMLKKPEIAVEVFGNYAKYNIPLTLYGARKLLHATYDTHPLIIPVTISSFFRIYKLPSLSNDLPCCSMLLSACLKDGSENAMVIAEHLTASLKWVLTTEEPQPIPQSQEKGDDMPRVWASWALKKIEEKLSNREGNDVEWLHSWRMRSGHIAGSA